MRKLWVYADFINASDNLQIPPLTNIRELTYASQEIEKSEEKNLLPEKKWLTQLLRPGTSLGGARPKASVMGEDKILYIAKFPSRKDDYNVGLEEYMLDRSTALLIIENVVNIIKDWRQVAIRLQIPKSEIELFSYRLDKWGMWTP